MHGLVRFQGDGGGFRGVQCRAPSHPSGGLKYIYGLVRFQGPDRGFELKTPSIKWKMTKFRKGKQDFSYK